MDQTNDFSLLDGALKQQKNLTFVDTMTVKDMKRNILSEVTLVPTKQKSALGGFFGKKQKDNPPQGINQVLIKITQDGNKVA